ncbi:MAG: hypothetical protein GEV03_27875 [Streptosporangiales bacterium]|nr:hypothetical protein [Streptosporangiales bacterium]
MATVEEVRRIALSLPETEERLAWGMPTFRVRGKIFCSLSDDELREVIVEAWRLTAPKRLAADYEG